MLPWEEKDAQQTQKTGSVGDVHYVKGQRHVHVAVKKNMQER